MAIKIMAAPANTLYAVVRSIPRIVPSGEDEEDGSGESDSLDPGLVAEGPDPLIEERTQPHVRACS